MCVCVKGGARFSLSKRAVDVDWDAGRASHLPVPHHGRARRFEARSAIAAVLITFLEVFVAFLQAFIFMFLTAVFISLMSHHDDHEEHESHESHDAHGQVSDLQPAH